MDRLKKFEVRMLEAPDKQLSLTDPDARSMKSRGSGMVVYNAQTAVDVNSHLIVATTEVKSCWLVNRPTPKPTYLSR